MHVAPARVFRTYLVGACVVSALGATAGAQSTVNSAFGSRNLGGSFSGGGGTFGGTPSGGALGLGGAAGGSVAGLTTRGDTSAGAVTGSERFLRNNRQAGQFVGADSSDASNAFSQMAAYSMMSQMARQAGTSNPNRNSGTSSGSAPKARVQTTLGFLPPMLRDDRVSATLQQRLAKSSWIEKRGPIRVWMEGRTAVLSGTVATEHDRALAEQVARLEAGVGAVRNDLTTPLPASSPAFETPSPSSPPADLPAPQAPSAPQVQPPRN